MPRMTSLSFGVGDVTWLGSDHGLFNARTETVNLGAFTAGTSYPNGYLPSGTAVALVAGLLVPYDATEATVTGAGILAGFIVTDQPVVGAGNVAVPLLDHGRVHVGKLPNAFTAPVATAKRANSSFIYLA